MHHLPLMFLLMQPIRVDGLHFIDLQASEAASKKLAIAFQIQPFAPYAFLNDQGFAFSPEVRSSLDGPIQDAFQIAHVFDQQRSAKVAALPPDPTQTGETQPTTPQTSDKPSPFSIDIDFSLSCRTLQGDSHSLKKTKVRLALSATPGHLEVTKDNGQKWLVPLNILDNEPDYIEFLRRISLPNQATLRRPRDEAFVLDLYYQITRVTPAHKDFDETPVAKQLALLRSLCHLKRQEQLGTTYCYRSADQFSQYHSGQLYRLRELIHNYHAMRLKAKKGDQVTAELEALVDLAPAEAPILGLLARDYLSNNRLEDAYYLLRELEPLVLNHPPTAAIYRDIRAVRDLKRKKLLAKRSQFKPASEVKLEILSPEAGDYIGGDVEVVYQLEGKTPSILQTDLVVNGDVVVSADEPPFALRFKPTQKSGTLDLAVHVWFKNSTYAKVTIPARVIEIGTEEVVQRVSLRTVVSKGGRKFLTDLDQSKFQLFEEAKTNKIVSFTKDKAPLSIAVLVDTSGSMVGEKLYRAQYALNTFLSNLESKDLATVYTFDNKVLKIGQPTHDFTKLRPDLFTLRPHLTTSLHDAILVAHNDLRTQKGTKVLIILSDGNDSTSHTDAASLKSVLAKTNALVYPIIIDREGGLERRGAAYLDELAALSGSIVTELKSIHYLGSAFAQIYQELKSYYYIDFYSRQKDFDISKIEVKVKGTGKPRFHQFIREEEKLVSAR